MIIYFVIILAVASRFVPHMPNVGLITALAMFSAANMDWKKAAGITLAARFLSDIFLGFFAWPLMVAVYAAHLVGILFGVWIKNSNSNRWLKIAGSSLASSVLFFLATNFAFLYAEYPHNFSGVMLAYTNGLPFLRGTIVGDLGYSVALFGAFGLALYFKSKTLESKSLVPNS